ncbi:MBL fold metallo-hydrolase [Limnoglobus roseus]|uniref:Zn-dependent hydrolase n=1 Tax=Limnoglobus roseus TaxID=2598579 RepID=A0A5C1APS9_9BACT|nr:MBL fold metallo-hydrolase [Limnoglobus roseus]QEL20990.1 Zn-dependent hydrolase [Limnoglobus roseus]
MLRCLVALSISLLMLATAAAQPAKSFKVRWFGQSFFQIETPVGKKIVLDPHLIPAFGRPIVTADVILISHEHNDHNALEAVEGAKSARVFKGLKENKGRVEWERIDEKVGGIRIRSVASYHDNENGLARGKNTIFIVEAEGLTFCHLGDLGHELNDEQIKAIGKVDVLMIPVGGTYTINGEQAKALVEKLKPRLFILPMHYGLPNYDDLNGPDEFLDGQKLKVKKVLTSNELAIPADAKADAPTIILLSPGEMKKK